MNLRTESESESASFLYKEEDPGCGDIPSIKRLIASLYLAQFSPIADLRLVYRGSKSMRCALLAALTDFDVATGGTPLGFDSDRDAGVAVAIGSGRLNAAGSMSGIAGAGGSPAKVRTP